MYSAQPGFSITRIVIVLLAVAGLGWLLLRIARPATTQISVWGVGASSAAVAASLPVAPAAAETGGINIVTQQVGQGQPAEDALKPHGNPLQSTHSVVTQGYGVGSHAPAETWGAIDLALDSDGDGSADPQGTLGQPIYATHSGVVKLASDTWPAGNHIWVANDSFRTGYSHLQGFAVEDGQEVQPGTMIGYIGSTGAASGPHLDYQVWEMVDGSWVNRNPYDFGGADGAK